MTSNVREVIEEYRLVNDANEAPLASLHSIAAKTTRGVVNMLKALKSDVEGKGEYSCHCENEKTGGPCRTLRHGPWGGWQLASLAMRSGTEPLAYEAAGADAGANRGPPENFYHDRLVAEEETLVMQLWGGIIAAMTTKQQQ